MREIEINILLQGYLRTLLPDFNGYPLGVVGVQADNQYRQAGRPDEAAIFVHQIGRSRVGWMSRKNTVNKDPDTGLPVSNTRTQKQRIETTFQFSALVPQSPAALDCECLPPTEVDVLDAAAMLLQSTYVIDDMRTKGIAMLRVGQVRSLWVAGDDREQNVNNPSFDIIVIHNTEFSVSVPLIDSITLVIDRV